MIRCASEEFFQDEKHFYTNTRTGDLLLTYPQPNTMFDITEHTQKSVALIIFFQLSTAWNHFSKLYLRMRLCSYDENN